MSLRKNTFLIKMFFLISGVAGMAVLSLSFFLTIYFHEAILMFHKTFFPNLTDHDVYQALYMLFGFFKILIITFFFMPALGLHFVEKFIKIKE